MGLLEDIQAARGGAAPNLLQEIQAARGAPAAPAGMPGSIFDNTGGPGAFGLQVEKQYPGATGEALNAATNAARHGATLGFDDEVGAAGGAVGDVIARAIMGKPVSLSMDSGRGLSSLVTGQADPTLGSLYDANLADQRQQAADEHAAYPTLSTIAEIIGGLTGVRGTGAPAPATAAGRIAQGAAVGGGLGAAAGFGNAEGGVENRASNAAESGGWGALVGGAIPAIESGIGALTRAIFTRDPQQAADTLGAFERQGIRPTAAAVGGRNTGTQLENYGEMVPVPGNPVGRAREQQHTQFGQRVDQVARAGGGTPAQDADEFGNIIRREANAGADAIRGDISAAERSFAQQFGDDTGVGLSNSRAAIAQMMERADPETRAMLQSRLAVLDEATGTAQQRAAIQDTISHLQAMVNDPVAGPTAQAEIARLQQQAQDLDVVPYRVFDNTRKRIGRATDGQSIDAQFTGPIYGGLSADMQAAADSRGLGQQWRQMKAQEEQVYNSDRSPAQGGDLDFLEPASGSKGGGDLFRQFIGSNFQNGDKIAALMRNASPRGVADIQASTIASLARSTPGAQNAAGDQVSAATFLTNWNKMSQNAKEQIFGSDHQLMSDLDDLAQVAAGLKNTRGTANNSNSGRTLITGATGAAIYSNPVGAAVGGAGGYAALQGLVSQRLARWAAGRGPDFAARFARSIPGLFTLPGMGDAEGEGDPTVNAIMKARGNGNDR